MLLFELVESYYFSTLRLRRIARRIIVQLLIIKLCNIVFLIYFPKYFSASLTFSPTVSPAPFNALRALRASIGV